MIFQDFYETRPNLKRESSDREVINRLKDTGLAIPNEISNRTLWLLTTSSVKPSRGNTEIPSHLINWNIQVDALPKIERGRVSRAFNRLQQVVDHESPLVTVYQIGSLRSEIQELASLAAYREFKWMYPEVGSVRHLADPDLLFRQIGGYEAELVFGILGWSGSSKGSSESLLDHT